MSPGTGGVSPGGGGVSPGTGGVSPGGGRPGGAGAGSPPGGVADHRPYIPVLPWTDDLAMYSRLAACNLNSKCLVIVGPLIGGLQCRMSILRIDNSRQGFSCSY